MSILGRNPMDPNQQGPMGRQIQGGPTVDMGSPTTDLAMQAAPGVATAAMGALPTVAIPGVAATTSATGALIPGAAAIPATAGSGILGGIGTMLGAGGATGGAAAAGASGMAAMAPMLAAAGPFALMALPFLLNDGTNKVPEQDFGPDPLAQGYNNGTPGAGFAQKFLAQHPMGGILSQVPGVQMAQKVADQHPMGNVISQLPFGKILGLNNGIPGVPGLASMAMDKLGIKSPMSVVGKALGFNDGTSCVGVNCNCDSCKRKGFNYGTNSVPGYMNGTGSITPTTAMHLAGGEDSVPAMLTPKEAVIPAPAAQNPKNMPMINSMINEGRAANAAATGEPMPQPEMSTPAMAGPLSGKSQREQMKLMQDMSFKKKAFEAEEMRKQMAFEQKMSQGNMKAMLAMRQSQE